MLQYIYHYKKDMEFSGFYQAFSKNTDYFTHKYFLFIKIRNLIYIDVFGIGEIIIPFERLLKHKYLRMYYELSTNLIENTHQVIEEKRSGFYADERKWFINTAYFVKHDAKRTIESGKYCCYYNIDPNSLKDACVSNDEDIATFFTKLKKRNRYEKVRHFVDYTNLMLEYNIALIERETDKLSAGDEDNKNIDNLIALNTKTGMNDDIFRLLYSRVISTSGQHKYDPFVKC
jgi:hypothetical protein